MLNLNQATAARKRNPHIVPATPQDMVVMRQKALAKRREIAAVPKGRRFALTDAGGEPAKFMYELGGFNKRGVEFRFGRARNANPDGFFIVFTERRKRGAEDWERTDLVTKRKRSSAMRAVSKRQADFRAEFGDQTTVITA